MNIFDHINHFTDYFRSLQDANRKKPAKFAGSSHNLAYLSLELKLQGFPL